jgi:transcriptional regulator with XRE-family HTH domain
MKKQFIIQYLEKNGKRQNWLAERAGVNPSVISRMISGENAPDLPTIVKIAKAMGIKPGTLVNRIMGE